jgi:hypothetical protein
MKQLITLASLFFTTTVFSQNVGIGISTPDEKLQVDSTIRVGKNEIINIGSSRKNTVKFGDGDFVTVGEQDKDDRLVMKAGSFTFKNGSVGIGVDSAKEKLDIAGNANITGQLKFNNNAGLANQVLMKDGSNNPIWGDMSEFKNVFISACFNNALTTGTNNCTTTWIVPAGITEIIVECWGGGGGGGSATAGAGGGYATFRQTVTPGNTANLIIGAGGGFGNATTNGIAGGTSVFTIAVYSIRATGGQGGSKENASQDPSYTVVTSYGGFGAANSSANIDRTFSLGGSQGGISKVSFVQANSTDFLKEINFGDGGVPPFVEKENASKGGYYLGGPIYLHNMYAQNANVNSGCGGGADNGFGASGTGGKIIIHY